MLQHILSTSKCVYIQVLHICLTNDKIFPYFSKTTVTFTINSQIWQQKKIDMTLRQVHHIWWSASRLATFHQEPMFTFVAAQNHLTGRVRSAGLCRKKWKDMKSSASWSVAPNLNEFSWVICLQRKCREFQIILCGCPTPKPPTNSCYPWGPSVAPSFSYFWPDQWPTTSSGSHHSSMDSFQDQSGVLYIPESFPLNSKPRWQEVLGYLIKVIELRMSCPGSSYMALSKLRKWNQESQKRFLVTW